MNMKFLKNDEKGMCCAVLSLSVMSIDKCIYLCERRYFPR